MKKNSSYWYCPNCKIELDGCHVTYEEKCEHCGTAVLSVPEGISQGRLEEIIEVETEGRLVVLPETGIGDLSDGYHTFNELYHHRAILFSVICNEHPDISWKSKLHHDGTMFDGMFIVGINTPEGQATYHYDINPYWDMFRVRELEKAPEWDGHTSEQAIERIAGLTLAEAEEALKGAEHDRN